MSNVSRSVYQRKSEECKRLLSDIRTIVMCNGTLSDEAREVVAKYRKQFIDEEMFNKTMKEFASEYIRKNPKEFKFLNGETNSL